MWHVSYYLYYDCVVNLTALSVQLHIYATDSIAKWVHLYTVVKIKALPYLPGMDSIDIKYVPLSMLDYLRVQQKHVN